MGKLVTPETYLIGYTGIDANGISDYLDASGNADFAETMDIARQQGLSEGEILCSFYAKLCYASLTLGKNANVTRVRDIPDNLIACFSAGHGSVFEHVQLNFVVRNCSRVFTHELVRHRVGTAFSQTSGRYVRGDSVDIVFDPILEPVRHLVTALQETIEQRYRQMVVTMGLEDPNSPLSFDVKKKITSALRRMLPNGQSNEMGFSCNLRCLRHLIMLRTARFAEWEIRLVFNQIYALTKKKFPLLYHGAKEEMIDGALEITGMKIQPWEKVEGV